MKTQYTLLFGIGVLLIAMSLVSALVSTAGTAGAQQAPPLTGDGDLGAAPSNDSILAVPQVNGASNGDGDPLPPPSEDAAIGVPQAGGPLNGDGQDATAPQRAIPIPDVGPDTLDGTSVTFTYYHVLGTHLEPRASTTTYAYGGNGCRYVTGGTDTRLTFPVNIPEESTIKYLRIYYLDTATQDMTAWLTAYQPGQSSMDLTSVSSTGTGGYGTMLSNEITHTVAGVSYQYSINYGWGTTGTTNQICGVRIAYYAPVTFPAFLPLLRRDATAP
jgi:hypothetical protein